MNGVVRPVIGSSREMPPVTTKICTARVSDSPAATSFPKESVARSAVRKPRLIRMAKRISTAARPTKPSSSPIEERMKSDQATGTFWG